MNKSDAIVLLAGSYLERAPVAAALFHSGYSNKIILTNDGVGGGWSSKYGRNLTMIEWAEEELITLGVPRKNIEKLVFYKSGTIYDALAVANYARQRSLKRLIVVTSAYHTQRALWCFRYILKDTIEVRMHSDVNFGNGRFKNPLMELVKFAWYRFKYTVLRLTP